MFSYLYLCHVSVSVYPSPSLYISLFGGELRVRAPRGDAHTGGAQGRAVQVEPGLTVLGFRFQRLKLEDDEPLSNVAFNCNLRRYTEGVTEMITMFNVTAGAYTRPLLSST